jgi:enterochelin esterase-like enzyme
LPHVYAEWPGVHDWAYWRAHVGESASWLLARVAGAS